MRSFSCFDPINHERPLLRIWWNWAPLPQCIDPKSREDSIVNLSNPFWLCFHNVPVVRRIRSKRFGRSTCLFRHIYMYSIVLQSSRALSNILIYNIHYRLSLVFLKNWCQLFEGHDVSKSLCLWILIHGHSKHTSGRSWWSIVSIENTNNTPSTGGWIANWILMVVAV